MSRKDDMSKAVIAICGTVLALFYAAMKFGGIEDMGKTSKNLMIAAVVAILISFVLMLIAMFLLPEKDFWKSLSDEEKNKTYILTEETKPVPSGTEFVLVKTPSMLCLENFETPLAIKRIYFSDSEAKIKVNLFKEIPNNCELVFCNRNDISKEISDLKRQIETLKSKTERLIVVINEIDNGHLSETEKSKITDQILKIFSDK